MVGMHKVVLNSNEKTLKAGSNNVKSESTYFTTPQM